MAVLGAKGEAHKSFLHTQTGRCVLESLLWWQPKQKVHSTFLASYQFLGIRSLISEIQKRANRSKLGFS